MAMHQYSSPYTTVLLSAHRNARIALGHQGRWRTLAGYSNLRPCPGFADGNARKGYGVLLPRPLAPVCQSLTQFPYCFGDDLGAATFSSRATA